MNKIMKRMLSVCLLTLLVVASIGTRFSINADYNLANEIGDGVISNESPSFQIEFNTIAADPSSLTYPLTFELYYKDSTGTFTLSDTLQVFNPSDLNTWLEFSISDIVGKDYKTYHVTLVDNDGSVTSNSTSANLNIMFPELHATGGIFSDSTGLKEIEGFLGQKINYSPLYEEPTRDGYIFKGWEVNGVGSNVIWDMENDNVFWHHDLFAVWEVAPVIQSYQMEYNANGATQGTTPTNSTELESTNYQVLGNAQGLQKPGFTFDGWNLMADGTGKAYKEHDIIVVSESLTFYAQWKPVILPVIEFTVSYDGNGESSGQVPASSVVEEQTTYSILSNINKLEKEGHVFVSWNTKVDGTGKEYKADDVLVVTENTVLYAQWKAVTLPVVEFTVSYDGNGESSGQVPASSVVEEQTPYSILSNINKLEKEGHVFVSWNTKADGTGKEYKADDVLVVTENTMLFAQWKAVDQPTSPEVKPEEKPQEDTQSKPNYDQSINGGSIEETLPSTGMSQNTPATTLGSMVVLSGLMILILAKIKQTEK